MNDKRQKILDTIGQVIYSKSKYDPLLTEDTIIICSQKHEKTVRNMFLGHRIYVEPDSVLPDSDSIYFLPIVNPISPYEYLDNKYSLEEILEMYKEECNAKM